MKYFSCTIAFFLIIMAQIAICSAHEGRPVYLHLTQSKTGEYVLRWKIPPVMPDNEIPHVELTGADCSLFSGKNTADLMGRKIYSCKKENPELSLRLNYPYNNPGLSTLVVFKRLDGTIIEVFTGPEKQIIPLPAQRSFTEIAQQYVISGIKHILAGYDHLLFVMCLLIISGSIRRMAVTITGFTLAHSITLALASFNIVQISVPLVEALIALSIVLLAAEILKDNRQTLAWRHPIGMAVIFGLLHGFGFASALGELNLPVTMKANALFFFNIGVEIGQLYFSLVLLLLADRCRKLLKNTRIRYRSVLNIGIYSVGVLSACWLVDRTQVLSFL